MTVFSSHADQVQICLSDFPVDTTHKPSVDVTMLSVASVFREYSLGIILTGMGSDGVEGMTAIRDAGGMTLGQDELPVRCMVCRAPAQIGCIAKSSCSRADSWADSFGAEVSAQPVVPGHQSYLRASTDCSGSIRIFRA